MCWGPEPYEKEKASWVPASAPLCGQLSCCPAAVTFLLGQSVPLNCEPQQTLPSWSCVCQVLAMWIVTGRGWWDAGLRIWSEEVAHKMWWRTGSQEGEEEEEKSESEFVTFHPNGTAWPLRNHDWEDLLEIRITIYNRTLNQTTEFKPDVVECSYNPSTWGQGQEKCSEFEANLDYIVRPCFKTQTTTAKTEFKLIHPQWSQACKFQNTHQGA